MWIALNRDTLLSRVTAPEASALNRAATDPAQLAVLDEIAAQVAAEWRGGLRRVTTLDARPDRVPPELLVHILADYRYRAYTRLPGMGGLMDDLRVEEWRRANQVRDNLIKVAVGPPEPAYAETVEQSGKPRPMISNPLNGATLG